MKKIFVLGSSVSRCILSFDEKSDFELVAYFAQISLASLGGKPAPLALDIVKVPAGWRRRMLQADHDKSILKIIANTEFDILLVDLIDERFNLLKNDDGSLVTFSTECRIAAHRPLGGRLLPSGSPEYVHYWMHGVQRLISTLEKYGKIDSLRVNRVFWADKTSDGRDIEGFEREKILAANRFLEDRYRDIENLLGEGVFYTYQVDMFCAAVDHKWGVSPFNYIDKFYAAAAKKLLEDRIFANQLDLPQPESKEEWSVELESAGGVWVARIIGYSDKLPGEFAFYLKRGNDLVAKQWYSPKMMASFQPPRIPGEYHAVGFVRVNDNKSPDIKKSAPVRTQEFPLYDLQQWSKPVFDYGHDSFWPERDLLRDGIHRFSCDDGDTIDICLEGIDRLKEEEPVLVCFTGAVNRNAGAAPFFAGFRIAKKLDVPIIAFADPVLGQSSSLALGWYAGSEKFSDLPRKIATLIDAFSIRYKTKFVVFGGSGGGFATISVLDHMTSPASGFVWNPQTSIGKYGSAAVKNYLDTAFPSEPDQDETLNKNRLEAAGIRHDLTRVQRRMEHPLLYLQNQSDKHHLEQHARPYALTHQCKRISKTVFADSRGLVFWLGDWGKGHAVPPIDMILSVLEGLLVGRDPETLAIQLEQEEGHGIQFDL